MTWDIGADWKPDPYLRTEVEVKVVAEGCERTRVELEHRKLERYGEKAEMMRALFDAPDAWLQTLETMARLAEQRYAGTHKQ